METDSKAQVQFHKSTVALTKLSFLWKDIEVDLETWVQPYEQVEKILRMRRIVRRWRLFAANPKLAKGKGPEGEEGSLYC